MATTVSSYILTRLKQAGLGHIFSVPGDYAGPFLETLDQTQGIERVPNMNELGCGYAADGYARYKGIGAACVQYGVGGFSILNCTAGSFVERLPVAVISASPGTKSRVLEETEGILFHHSTGDLRADQIVFKNVPVARPPASPGTKSRVLEETEGILFHHSTGDLRADQIVFKNVTVASEIISDPEQAPAQIERAITAMLTHRRP